MLFGIIYIMRRISFANGQIYHLYNRGVEKRNIFLDKIDLKRFVDSVELFNDIEPAGSFYERGLLIKKGKNKKPKKLVKIICFAFNPNHYHLLVEQMVEKGIEKFMQKLGTGYTMFFNKNIREADVYSKAYSSLSTLRVTNIFCV